MRRSLLLALLVCATPGLAAQEAIPDPTDPARYFPMDVGNTWTWIISGVTENPGFPDPDGAITMDVRRDSVVAGQAYVEVETRSWSVGVSGDTTRVTRRGLIRFDAESARVVQYREGQDEELWPGSQCPLDSPYSGPGATGGESIACPEGFGIAMVHGGSDEPFEVGGVRYTGQVKQINQLWEGATFVADVGQVYWFFGDIGYVAHTLQYARVGGVEYGDRTGLQTEAPLPRPRVTSIRRAFPNPFADAFTVAIDHPRSGQVRVEVFDVLGRRVYADEPFIPFGRTELRIALPPGAPGVYTARVQSASDRWPARPVRLVRSR